MKSALAAIALFSVSTLTYAYTPSEIISGARFSEYSKENCDLVSKAGSSMREYARTNFYDCDFETLDVVHANPRSAPSGYVNRDICSIGYTSDGLMIGSVGCGYNNTDNVYIMYYDTHVGSVVKAYKY